MVHKIKQTVLKEKEVTHGFDLTQVSSDKDFEKLLNKYGFKKVSSHRPEDKRDTGISYGAGFQRHSTSRSGKLIFKEGNRFKEYDVTYRNPNGIRLHISHLGGVDRSDKGFLGFVNFNAPSSAYNEMESFIKEFRGRNAIKGSDWNGKRGIARYIKEETPSENF